MLDKELIRKAFRNMHKGKTKRPEIIKIEADFENEVEKMYQMILNTKPPDVPVEHPELAFKPGDRNVFHIHENGKDRKICRPDVYEQWMQHIIVLVLIPIITRTAYPVTCGSFPKRGAHCGKKHLLKWIKSGNIRYFLKMDIRHFFDSVSYDVLKNILRVYIADEWFIHIIMLCFSGFKRGLPIGFYLSQWLANFVLESLDWMIVRSGFDMYVRFMDDMVIGDSNKRRLHRLRVEVQKFIGRNLRLKLKKNYQVFKFEYNGHGRALDFMGFVFHRNRTSIRKRVMFRITRTARRLGRMKEEHRLFPLTRVRAMISYMGSIQHTDSYNLYLSRIKPYVDIRQLKRISSRAQRRMN